MAGVRNRANNAPPLAGAEPHLLPDHHRNLPKLLHRVGFATSATAVGGLLKQLVPSSARSRQAAEDVPEPLAQLTLFFLLFTLFGGLSTLYVGRRVEAAATPGWRKAGVTIHFLCSLLFIAAASLVGSNYGELALKFID